MRWRQQGNALREWRVHVLEWTQRQLAEEIGLPRQQISMMESGQARAGLDALARIEAMGGPKATEWADARTREAVPA